METPNIDRASCQEGIEGLTQQEYALQLVDAKIESFRQAAIRNGKPGVYNQDLASMKSLMTLRETMVKPLAPTRETSPHREGIKNSEILILMLVATFFGIFLGAVVF